MFVAYALFPVLPRKHSSRHFYFFGLAPTQANMHRATLASLALVLLVVASASAQCNFAARQLYPLQDIIKCQNQVPFSDAFRQATLDTVSKVMRLYAFRDIVANSPQSGLSYVALLCAPKHQLMKDMNNFIFKKIHFRTGTG
jgi:hypothetical protein